VHVKHFMIRHKALLGLTAKDVTILRNMIGRSTQ
jgi:hypothetical protein